MRWFAALLTQPRRFFMVFVAAELLLAMAIPFMAIEGYHTLLESRAGRFVEEPTRSDPGWRAFVDPTPIVAIAEVDQGRVTGLALLIHPPDSQATATVVLVPGTLELDGLALAGRTPEAAIAALGATMRLSIERSDVLDQAGWVEVLGSDSYPVESPDPVQDVDGASLFTVGQVSVEGANAAAFLGRPAPGAPPISVKLRRHLLWSALTSSAPGTDTELAADLRALTDTAVQVVDLPTTQLEPVAIIDGEGSESLIRDVVAYPSGAVPGDRLQVRILDRTGTADLEGIAAAVAAQGMEVIEIGNAMVFDNDETQVIAPVSLASEDGSFPPELDVLSLSVGSGTVDVDNEAIDDHVVTIVIGRNFDLANLH